MALTEIILFQTVVKPNCRLNHIIGKCLVRLFGIHCELYFLIKSGSYAHIMAKAEQVLVIDPNNELTFVGPFTTAVSATMTLKNPSDRKVCFKIKTTAPKRYCVKPNSGVIDPRETVQIAGNNQIIYCNKHDIYIYVTIWQLLCNYVEIWLTEIRGIKKGHHKICFVQKLIWLD